MSARTETPETNRRINTLIMRGLSATEATEQAVREASRNSLHDCDWCHGRGTADRPVSQQRPDPGFPGYYHDGCWTAYVQRHGTGA